MENDGYMTKANVAARYGVAVVTIERWIKEEKAFPKPYRFGSGPRPKPLWKISDLEKWDEKARPPTDKN